MFYYYLDRNSALTENKIFIFIVNKTLLATKLI